jgi:SOS-response transcriptional repressor LexA
MEGETVQQTSDKRVSGRRKLQPVFGDKPIPDAPFVMVVEGDCMEPEVHVNDIIVCVPCAIPNDGDMVVLHTYTGFLLRRYVVKDGCHPVLVANNETYLTKELRQHHKICGKVVDIQRRH